jgi:hypothetical protein
MVDALIQRGEAIAPIPSSVRRNKRAIENGLALALSRAADLAQYGLDPAPELGLLLVAGVLEGGRLLGGLCDGFRALCFEKVMGYCGDICRICIHLAPR